MRVDPNLLLLGLVSLLLACPFGLSSQENECPKAPLLLSPSEPIYSDAMRLKQTLESHGFVVRCVFPTKLGSVFEVREGGLIHATVAGEANFRTNYGEVDAVFLPAPQTFSDFKITEHRKDSGFLYTFGGTPRSCWRRFVLTKIFGRSLKLRDGSAPDYIPNWTVMDSPMNAI